MTDDRSIGPNTYAFGAYLATMAIALALVRSVVFFILYSGLAGMLAWVTQRRLSVPSHERLRHECLFYALGMNVTFEAMGGAIPAIRSVRYDSILLDADRWMFTVSPNVWADQFAFPALTDIMSVCYLFFMPLLFVGLVRYLFWQKELLGIFYRGLFTVYGIGFLGYLLVPAAGPYLAYPDLFSTPLEGGLISRLTHTMVIVGSNKVDVFPSLHCAVSAYMLGFAFRYHRKEFWWILAPIVGLWMSTIYLRYHYVIDVICGFALAFICLTLIWRPRAFQPDWSTR